MSEPRLTIAAVERDLGLSKDVLRVWERRYGFPAPERDAHGERLYPLAQVERLRLIKRLMDQGHRPGRLMASGLEDLLALVKARPPAEPLPGQETHGDTLDGLIALIKQHDMPGYTQAMQQRLARDGLQCFVQDTMAPLSTLIGRAWEDGDIAVYEEHLFTELSQRVLRHAMAGITGGQGPRVLLTSLPDEPHGLGLLMVEGILSLEGARCIPLGTQMPMLSVVEAASAHQADVVALSFSIAFPSRQIPPLLQQIRAMLPDRVALWAGGRGVARLTPQAGVRMLASLSDVPSAVNAWRQQTASPA